MAKKIISDRLCTINTDPTYIAKLLNKAHPLNMTETDMIYLQRTLNIAAHFAKAFITQQPPDFMIWAEHWGQSMDFLTTRFEVQEPIY